MTSTITHFKEITVVLKGEEKRYTQKFPIYASITCDPDDEIIRQCIKEAQTSFNDDDCSIDIKITMSVQ